MDHLAQKEQELVQDLDLGRGSVLILLIMTGSFLLLST